MKSAANLDEAPFAFEFPPIVVHLSAHQAKDTVAPMLKIKGLHPIGSSLLWQPFQYLFWDQMQE